MQQNPRVIAKQIRVRTMDGKVITLRDYMKTMDADMMTGEILIMLDTMKSRVGATRDRGVLKDIYIYLVAQRFNKGDIIDLSMGDNK